MLINKAVFPFSAIVGQENMKLALILNIINPHIGGVLLRGEKGTAKSTTVRALTALFTEMPVVDLPLGATEDRVLGTIDLEAAIKQGKKVFCPGLLARANGGILYIDEVNLLADNLGESILDALESGTNILEREGMSFSHTADFSLVGSMNPEEGSLRPQILDRFGFCVDIKGEENINLRVELLKRRENFDSSPENFIEAWLPESKKLMEQLTTAREKLESVVMPDYLRPYIVELVCHNHVAGHRADITLERAAKTHTAWCERQEVSVDDILAVAEMVFRHRTRQTEEKPPPPPPENNKEENQSEESDKEEKQQESGEMPPEEEHQQEEPQNPELSSTPPDVHNDSSSDVDNDNSEVFKVGNTFNVQKIEARRDTTPRHGRGRRTRTNSGNKQGRYIRAVFPKGNTAAGDLAVDATLRAAAPYQRERGLSSGIKIHTQDIRQKFRVRKTGNLLLFVIDGSGSMGAEKRMEATKGAIMSLLLDAYQKRDQVSLIVFRGKNAEVILPPTNSIDLAAKYLNEMPVGGRTPLASGLVESGKLLKNSLRQNHL